MQTSITQACIHCSGVVKIFQLADLEVVALQGLDLDVARGEILALVGPSGSGKSTLLNVLGGLDRPSAGQVEVDGQNLLLLDHRELTTYRREQVGFVWQQTTRNLLPYLTARENIALLMTLTGYGWRARRAWITELLAAVDMHAHRNHRPGQLSGGQQQRIAIACALANKPTILLADEPTGDVDWPTAQRILQLFHTLRERYGLTIVIVTHDPRVAAQADRVVAIRDGRTSTETLAALERAGISLSPEAHLDARDQPPKEQVILDTAGRLQLPAEQLVLAGIGRRAYVELVDGGLIIRPGDSDQYDSFTSSSDTSSRNDSWNLYGTDPPPEGNGSKHVIKRKRR